MISARQIAVLTLTALACAACSVAEENVLFVTSTEIGIDADAKTGSATIGAGRNEVMVGPAYVDTGGSPPVVATIQSNLSVFNPKVSQLFATGNAARLAAGEEEVNPVIGDADDLSGTRRAMYFGTRSSVGLRLGFTEGSPAPTSITFGYKRQELSVIPLKETGKRSASDRDRYASVYAAIDLRTTAESLQKSGIELDQYFATGTAAERLAMLKGVRDVFKAKAVDAAREAARAEGRAVAENLIVKVAEIVSCVQPVDGALTPQARQRLATLVDEAGKRGRIVDASFLKSIANTSDLSRELLDVQQTSVEPLIAQLGTGVPACG